MLKVALVLALATGHAPVPRTVHAEVMYTARHYGVPFHHWHYSESGTLRAARPR